MRLSLSAVIACGLGFLFFIFGGMLVLLVVLGVLTHHPTTMVPTDLASMTPDGLLLIGMAGALGSIASIMLRLEDFAYEKIHDPWPFFFFGICKPIVGASFAVFVFATIGAATLLPIELPTQSYQVGLFLLSLAVVAGFSERFAADIIASTEHVALPTEGTLEEQHQDKKNKLDGGITPKSGLVRGKVDSREPENGLP